MRVDLLLLVEQVLLVSLEDDTIAVHPTGVQIVELKIRAFLSETGKEVL
jgi:hypothetical protein